jgi:hypothetical protein
VNRDELFDVLPGFALILFVLIYAIMLAGQPHSAQARCESLDGRLELHEGHRRCVGGSAERAP